MIRSAPSRLAARTPGEPDGAVTDEGDGLAALDLRADGGVVARRHQVRQRQQRAHHLVGVPGAGHRHQRGVGKRYTDGLALAAVAVIGKKPPLMQAVVMPFWQLGHVPSLKANVAITRSPF